MAAPAECPCSGILGTWQCEKARDVDLVNFLSKMGMGMIKRNLAASMQPTTVFTWEEGAVKIKNGTSDNSATNTVVVDGVTVNTLENPAFGGTGTATAPDANTMVMELQPTGKDFQVRITRTVVELDGAQYLETTMEALTNGDVTHTAKRFFKKQ